MSKTELTKEIERELYFWASQHAKGHYGCFECCLGLGNKPTEFVDYMTMDSNEIFRCYEIKISLSDLKSKCKLSFKGDFNYLVMSKSLWDELVDKKLVTQGDSPMIKYEVGISVSHLVGYLIYDNGNIKQIRKPKHMNLLAYDRLYLMHCMTRSLSRYTERIIKHEQ